ncbi:Transmembrane protein [Entamoeba marina]
MNQEQLIVTSISLGIVGALCSFMILLGHMEIIGLVMVGMLWGCTNPFMKKGIQFEHEENCSILTNLKKDVITLVTSFSFIIPFLINQSGSIIFTLMLGSHDLSLVIPLSNALTFIFTFITAYLLGETKLSKRYIMGVLLVLVGVTICQTAK